MMEGISRDYTDEVTCPYCGYEYDASWEFFREHSHDSTTTQCEQCDKHFSITINHEVTYSTQGLCAENNVDHMWKEFETSRHTGKRCTICDKYEFDKQEPKQ